MPLEGALRGLDALRARPRVTECSREMGKGAVGGATSSGSGGGLALRSGAAGGGALVARPSMGEGAAVETQSVVSAVLVHHPVVPSASASSATGGVASQQQRQPSCTVAREADAISGRACKGETYSFYPVQVEHRMPQKLGRDARRVKYMLLLAGISCGPVSIGELALAEKSPRLLARLLLVQEPGECLADRTLAGANPSL